VKSQSNFDIVVYGATGFTRQLVAEYLASRYRCDNSLKWAMAGRSADKLASVRDAIGAPADTALIHAEAGDLASLRAMIDQAKLVVSTVGPYQLYGSEMVALCAESGTDYVDLCGEPVWMRQMIDAHQATAHSTGARIVFRRDPNKCHRMTTSMAGTPMPLARQRKSGCRRPRQRSGIVEANLLPSLKPKN
jgi:short subunit dehydrogenase-like uncharacterized protein